MQQRVHRIAAFRRQTDAVPQTFRNRKAVFLWGFMACWMAMLLAFTWLFLRDGAPAGTSPPPW